MTRALLASFVLMAAPALAQPAVLPLHDVAVTYRLAGAAQDAIPGGAPGPLRLAWQAARQLLRVQPDGRTQALLVDLPAHRVEVIDSGLHTAMALPVREGDLSPLRLQDAKLTPRGRAVVAGLPCTLYDAEARRGHGTVCLTDDGVPLSADGEVNGKRGSFTAIAVDRAPQPAAMFVVPQGYMRLALPAFGPRQ